ncbi:MAG: VWA domain-containing protein [Acidobacteria bacterium]|nr:VWA domain-containing protein [Acidobacteriota bacterium]
MVRFAEPARLSLLVLPAIGLAGAWLRHRRRRMIQQRLASPSVWRQVMGGVPATGLGRLASWCLAAAFIVLALARPQWGELPRKLEIRTRDVVFAIDVSASMRCQDVQPSRLAQGLELLRRALPDLAGNRIGVVTFAGDAYPLVPLTTDLDAVGTFLEAVEPGSIALPGSNIERAVDTSLELLPAEGSGRVLVLVTDGENLQGDLKAAAKRLKGAGVRVLGVVVGTREGGPIPMPGREGTIHYKRTRGGRLVITHAHRDTLERLASATGGSVLAGDRAEAPHELASVISKLVTRKAGVTGQVRRIERFPLFLAAAAFFLALGFFLSPWRKAIVVVVLAGLLPVPAALARTTDSPPGARRAPPARRVIVAPWWQRWLPGGSRRLARSGLADWRRHKLDSAAKAFAEAASLDPKNPVRLYDLGTVLAARGDIAHAAPLLGSAARAGLSGADYNLGTAALMHHQAKPALHFLRKALLQRPQDPKVKRNYELALEMLRKQQQKSAKKKSQPPKKAGKQKHGKQPRPAPRQSRGRAPVNPVFGALERAEAQARKEMRRPTPKPVTVEKDW